jgi:hypothetical protein
MILALEVIGALVVIGVLYVAVVAVCFTDYSK